ncbi:MAG: hypothetical protein QM729_21205 [Solirubrobacterales bacterium]
MKYKLYGLHDPRTGNLRYIGKTVYSLPQRLASHIKLASRTPSRKVCSWIIELKALGLKPEIRLRSLYKTQAAVNEAEAYEVHVFMKCFKGSCLNMARGGAVSAYSYCVNVPYTRRGGK